MTAIHFSSTLYLVRTFFFTAPDYCVDLLCVWSHSSLVATQATSRRTTTEEPLPKCTTTSRQLKKSTMPSRERTAQYTTRRGVERASTSFSSSYEINADGDTTHSTATTGNTSRSFVCTHHVGYPSTMNDYFIPHPRLFLRFITTAPAGIVSV